MGRLIAVLGADNQQLLVAAPCSLAVRYVIQLQLGVNTFVLGRGLLRKGDNLSYRSAPSDGHNRGNLDNDSTSYVYVLLHLASAVLASANGSAVGRAILTCGEFPVEPH